VSLAVAGTVPVSMGNVYWLVLKPGAANEEDAWNLGAAAGLVAISSDDITWSNGSGGVVFLPAFRIMASGARAAPDFGSTFVLMLIAFGAMIAATRSFARKPSRLAIND
jgi:hypothetical protein